MHRQRKLPWWLLVAEELLELVQQRQALELRLEQQGQLRPVLEQRLEQQ